jgi:hypothetical protein
VAPELERVFESVARYISEVSSHTLESWSCILMIFYVSSISQT